MATGDLAVGAVRCDRNHDLRRAGAVERVRLGVAHVVQRCRTCRVEGLSLVTCDRGHVLASAVSMVHDVDDEGVVILCAQCARDDETRALRDRRRDRRDAESRAKFEEARRLREERRRHRAIRGVGSR